MTFVIHWSAGMTFVIHWSSSMTFVIHWSAGMTFLIHWLAGMTSVIHWCYRGFSPHLAFTAVKPDLVLTNAVLNWHFHVYRAKVK